MEGGEHPLDLPAPLRRALDTQPGRQSRGDLPLGVVDAGRVEQLDLDPINPADPVEQPLRGRDVEQRQLAVHHPRGTLVEQQPLDGHLVSRVADEQRDGGC